MFWDCDQSWPPQGPSQAGWGSLGAQPPSLFSQSPSVHARSPSRPWSRSYPPRTVRWWWQTHSTEKQAFFFKTFTVNRKLLYSKWTLANPIYRHLYWQFTISVNFLYSAYFVYVIFGLPRNTHSKCMFSVLFIHLYIWRYCQHFHNKCFKALQMFHISHSHL